MFGNFSRMPPGCDPCDLGLVEDRHRLRVSAQRKGVVWSTVPTCLGAVYEQHVTWVFWRYMPKKAVKMKGLGRKGPFFSDQLHPGQWDRSMSMPLTGSGWVDGVHSDCMACIRGDVSGNPVPATSRFPQSKPLLDLWRWCTGSNPLFLVV